MMRKMILYQLHLKNQFFIQKKRAIPVNIYGILNLYFYFFLVVLFKNKKTIVIRFLDRYSVLITERDILMLIAVDNNHIRTMMIGLITVIRNDLDFDNNVIIFLTFI